MPTAVIAVVAVFFLGMGIYGLVAPAALIRPFGVALGSPAARTEVRAVYGGFGVAMAGLLAAAAADAHGVRQGAVIAVACALGGMAAGRLVGWAADRSGGFYPTWFFFCVEAAAAAALVAVL
ncbi:DUF4345 domain-containing protein [Actinomadura nitritigenes]|uniref:DUF4345 family protein n=1 Tax=Actinomadura nitritigenes TaxID=134602 RepID=A0ABS3QUG1_9ACTN|nr:DUF4345 family protein [Actinomadura nitritigenes]MBO2437257.1 DUF4345 family protein [Actinomadura nitritigenes]